MLYHGYLQPPQLVFKKTEHMKNVLWQTYILESLWNEIGQQKHTTSTQLSMSRKKKSHFRSFYLQQSFLKVTEE